MATQRALPVCGSGNRGGRGRGSVNRGTRGQGGEGVASNAIQQPPTNTTTPVAAPISTPATTATRVTVRWETREFDHTDALIQFLEAHPADCCVLFNESKKHHDPVIVEPNPSGSQKGQIWAAIAHSIFEDDEEYKDMYAEDNCKFTLAVCNRLGHLRTKYKKQHARFTQTGAGINPLDATGAKNLREQVVIDFLWFDALDALWKGNPAFAPKTISSVPGIDHASNLAALTKGSGKDKQVAPPPDPSSLTGDTEIDFVIEDKVVDDTIDEMLDPLLTQGKGKEKALPPPSTNKPMVEEPSPDDMDCSSHIPCAEPPIPDITFDNADDNTGMQDWDDMG
ncbi:hypothetical protein BDR04DRAFT_1158488, partial [Suillus decipiens]